MFLLAPLAVEVPAGAGPWRPRLARACAALVVVVFLAERLAAAGAFPEWLTRSVLLAGAQARLYADPALFLPHQLWTATVMQSGWWELAAVVWGLLVPVAALERRCGPLVLAAVLLALAPLVSAGHLALPSPLAEPGGDGIILGLMAVGGVVLPGARIRWGVGWWLVAVAGFRALPATVSWSGALLAFALQASLCQGYQGSNALAEALASIAALLLGSAAGLLIARQARSAAPSI